MTSLGQKTVLIVACSIGVPHALAEEPAENTRPKVEFRRAESRPADGLTEAAVLMPPRKVYLHKVADATDEDIAEARAVLDRNSRPAVLLLFTKDGAKKMMRLSKQHQDRPLAILVDGQVIVAPELRTTLSDQAMITGNFTQREIDTMVTFINADVYVGKPKTAVNQRQGQAEHSDAAESR